MRRDRPRRRGARPGGSIMAAALASAMLLLASCGGGTSEPSIVYTGVTTEAAVTGANATELAQAAYRGGSTGASLGGFASVSGGGEAAGGRPGHLSLAVVVAKALEGVTLTPTAASDSTVLLVSTDTVSGFCSPNPGSLFYRINYDDSSGVFFGTMQFFAYCFDGVSLTGSASITGRVEPASILFLTLDISFNNLTAVSSGDSFTGSGSMSYDYTALSTTATLAMDLRDDSTGEVFRLDGISLTITDVISFFRVAIDGGKFFHPDFGHVTVSTAGGASLEFVFGDEFPRSGVFTLTGAGGTASRLTVLSNTQYMVTADTDGDGAFDDFASGNLLWADL